MRELKVNSKTGDGDVYAPMGCRSFLTPDRVKTNLANAKNWSPDKGKYWGRFNQGVVTINLPYVALESVERAKENNTDILTEFEKDLQETLELCHKALRCRHERLLGTKSDISPIHWQHGGLARLQPGETIDKLLYGGYSTISLGYAGLWECVKALNGEDLTSPNGEKLGLEIMQKLNDACSNWKAQEDIDYSDDENTDAVDRSDVPEVTLGCKVVIRNIDKETKTYKYDMVNGMLPKAVEVFTGCKVGDVIEMMGKEWRIEDVIF